MSKTVISVLLNIILIGVIAYFYVMEKNPTEKPLKVEETITKQEKIIKKPKDEFKNLITMDDIKIMQEMGVLVSFENDKEAYKIPNDMTPSKLIEANYLNFNGVNLFVLPDWLSKMHNLLWLDIAKTYVDSKELHKLEGLKNLKFLNISYLEHISVNDINLTSLLIGENLDKIEFSFDNEKESHLTSLDITQKRLLEAKHINLNGVYITQLPNWFKQMNNLVRLDLNSARLNILQFRKLSSLKHLKILDLTNNPLIPQYHYSSIVETLKKLPLTELSLEYTNGDEYNYQDIGEISTLVKLNLSRNKVSDLESLHLEKLKNLKSLNLSHNKLGDKFNTAHLPKESLVKLDLSFNDKYLTKINHQK